MIVALIMGTFLSLVALAYVLAPLIVGVKQRGAPDQAAALATMRSARTPALSNDDPAEAAIRAYRDAHPTCGTCGIRPEPDAIYCSSCGSFLPGKCGSCGAAVTAAGVRYCIGCGTRLAAWPLSARSSPASTSRS